MGEAFESSPLTVGSLNWDDDVENDEDNEENADSEDALVRKPIKYIKWSKLYS